MLQNCKSTHVRILQKNRVKILKILIHRNIFFKLVIFYASYRQVLVKIKSARKCLFDDPGTKRRALVPLFSSEKVSKTDDVNKSNTKVIQCIYINMDLHICLIKIKTRTRILSCHALNCNLNKGLQYMVSRI